MPREYLQLSLNERQEMASGCGSDLSFGPTLPIVKDASCRQFDFTVAFEDLVFVLVPSLTIFLIVLFRLPSVLSSPRVVNWPTVSHAKIILYSGLGVTQLAELCLYAIQGSTLTTTGFTLPAAATSFVAIIALASFSLIHHPRSVQPTVNIQLYLLLTLFLDVARLRTRWMLRETTVASASSAMCGFKMLLLFVESLPKQSHCIISGGRATSPEGFSGFFGKSLLLWLNPLFLRGYRRKLIVDDLYPIDDELASAKLTESLSGAWARTAPQRSRRLAWSLAKVFVGPLFLVQLPRFGLVTFAIAQPLLISAALDYVQRHASLPSSFGPAFIGAFALNYIAVAVSTVWSQHLTFRMLTMVRGALIGMIYKHSLLLHASDSNGGADAVSLISADVERILQTLQWVLNILPNVAQVAIGFYILYGRIGIVFVAPLIIAIACGMAIKSVKFSALTQTLSNQIQSCRESEIRDQKSFRRLQVVIISLGNTPAMLTPAATFAAFAITQSADPWNQFKVNTVTVLNGGNAYSGWQVRIYQSLARAAYSRKPFVIIDDMFSGLDAMTATSCFDTLIVTTAEQWHSLADQIFVLDNAGRMKASERLESFKRSSPDNIEAVKVGTDFEERAEQDSQHGSGHGKIERAVKIPSKVISSEKPNQLTFFHEEPGRNPQPGPLRYYMSLMGTVVLLVFGFLIVLHIGSNTIQRNFGGVHKICARIVYVNMCIL
ncbi:hypothetical protein WAI453_011124 [Rhynchosporium graminicola]